MTIDGFQHLLVGGVLDHSENRLLTGFETLSEIFKHFVSETLVGHLAGSGTCGGAESSARQQRWWKDNVQHNADHGSTLGAFGRGEFSPLGYRKVAGTLPYHYCGIDSPPRNEV